MKKHFYLSLLLTIYLPAIGQIRTFNFFLEMRENHTILVLESAETFPCAGYGIRAFQLWNNDTLIIDILGYKKPEPCYSSMDPALEKIMLLGIKTDTFYIKLRWREIKDKRYEDTWSVVTNRESFKVMPLVSTFSRYSK
jgi:hypothetical protein